MDNREPITKYGARPHQLVHLTRANKTVIIAGRGIGKTTDILAKKLYDLVYSMPGCMINFYAETYQQILLVTLKEIKVGWERLNFIEGLHYVVRKAPPKNWPRPYRAPEKPEFSIFFHNGTCIQLLSQDVFNNGGSSQAMVCDEARRLNQDKFNQVYLAMRDDSLWPGNPDFRSLTFTTDQPVSPQERWLFEYENMMDPVQIELIQHYQYHQDQLLFQLHTGDNSSNQQKQLKRRINKLQKVLNELRQGSVYFCEFSTIENIAALGVDYIQDMKRILPDHTFRISVLNERMEKPPNSFYPEFNIDVHTYNRFDYGYLGNIQPRDLDSHTQTCLQDGEINSSEGLDIALDVGGNINVVVTGQDHGDVYYTLSGFHVKNPEGITHLAENWCDYYEPHHTKEVRFIIDNTDRFRMPTQSRASDEFAKTLRKRGWTVYIEDIGVIPSPESRHLDINKLLREKDPRLPKLRLHKRHCNNLIIGIESAGIREGKSGWEKDKSAERNKSIPQERTTHLPDAWDKLICFTAGKAISNSTSKPSPLMA